MLVEQNLIDRLKQAMRKTNHLRKQQNERLHNAEIATQIQLVNSNRAFQVDLDDVSDYHYMTHMVKPIKLSPKDINDLKQAAMKNDEARKPSPSKCSPDESHQRKSKLVESSVTFFDYLLKKSSDLSLSTMIQSPSGV